MVYGTLAAAYLFKFLFLRGAHTYVPVCFFCFCYPFGFAAQCVIIIFIYIFFDGNFYCNVQHINYEVQFLRHICHVSVVFSLTLHLRATPMAWLGVQCQFPMAYVITEVWLMSSLGKYCLPQSLSLGRSCKFLYWDVILILGLASPYIL